MAFKHQSNKKIQHTCTFPLFKLSYVIDASTDRLPKTFLHSKTFTINTVKFASIRQHNPVGGGRLRWGGGSGSTVPQILGSGR